jgi:uncharacterized protein (DUF1800 family)
MASLAPNNAVLGEKYARHLLKRATFVYTRALVTQFASLKPAEAIELLFTEQPLVLPLPYDPTSKTGADGKWNTGTIVDGYWTERTDVLPTFFNDGQGRDYKVTYVSAWWWYNAINTPTIKFKLSHFLSTRFTVSRGGDVAITSASSFYDHIRLLLFYSFGNYKTLARKMTLDNSMLNYLNNTNNSKTAANQNYAREFLELFTIGKGPQIGEGNYTNYTETDVVQAARLLTGFRTQQNRLNIDADTGLPKGQNVISIHDTTAKTFSSAFGGRVINGRTTAAGMDSELNEFVEMVFGQDATALHICRKLYRYFVRSTISVEVERDIIAPLALELKANNYELMPTVKRLLTSLHFYDLDDTNSTDEIIGAMVKSPLQLVSEIITFFNCAIPNPNTLTNASAFYKTLWWDNLDRTYCILSTMRLFAPAVVAGHEAYYQEPGYDKAWISSSTLIARYRIGESLLDGKNRLRSGSPNMGATIDIVNAVRSGGIVSKPDDANIVTRELCAALFGQQPTTDRVNYFKKALVGNPMGGDQPDSYWTLEWTLYLQNNNKSVVEPRLKDLVKQILSAPEFQLF